MNNNNQLVCKTCRQGYIFNGTSCIESCAIGENFVNDYLIIENGQLVYKKEKKCFGTL